MKVTLEMRIVGGLIHLYPLDKTGKILAQAAKTKTLTAESIALFKQVGFEFKIKEQKL